MSLVATCVSLSAALGMGPPPPGNLAVPVFSHGSLVAELYTPRGHEPQTPHDRDEVYVVARGRASSSTAPLGGAWNLDLSCSWARDSRIALTISRRTSRCGYSSTGRSVEKQSGRDARIGFEGSPVEQDRVERAVRRIGAAPPALRSRHAADRETRPHGACRRHVGVVVGDDPGTPAAVAGVRCVRRSCSSPPVAERIAKRPLHAQPLDMHAQLSAR